MRAAVVVAGDLGRSPRMQYHAHALAASGVEVSVITRFSDWGRWDEIRKQMVLDRELVAWQQERRRLARSAQRRFLEPAAFSPLA